MENIDKIEKIKIDMIIADYNSGTSWDNNFFKKKNYENLDKVLSNIVFELIEEIREQNSLEDMED